MNRRQRASRTRSPPPDEAPKSTLVPTCKMTRGLTRVSCACWMYGYPRGAEHQECHKVKCSAFPTCINRLACPSCGRLMRDLERYNDPYVGIFDIPPEDEACSHCRYRWNPRHQHHVVSQRDFVVVVQRMDQLAQFQTRKIAELEERVAELVELQNELLEERVGEKRKSPPPPVP
jgi:hypothetical protein